MLFAATYIDPHPAIALAGLPINRMRRELCRRVYGAIEWPWFPM